MKRWLIVIAAVLLPVFGVRADTVYLKNGAWIDGVVKLKTSTFIELQIGDIGKIDLPIEEVHSIEKNSRTGTENMKSYVEPKGKTERVDSKAKQSSDASKKKEKSEGASKTEKTEKSDPGEGSPDKPKDGASDQSTGDEVKKGEEAGAKDSAENEDEGAKDEPTAGAADGEKDGGDVKKPDIDPELKKRIDDLVDQLQRQKSRNRAQAERHLEAIGQPAIPALLGVAKSSNELVRIAVMRLFNSFGDDSVIDAAIDALLDDNEYVRDYANKILKRVTGEDFGFLCNASPRRRETAQKKWSDWWAKEKKTISEDRKLSEKSR